MSRQVAFLQWKPVKILTLSRHVLDIISYVALFYVIHVIHRLLKYVSSNDKYSKVWRILFVWHSFEKNTRYMKLCSRTRCWRWDLIATIISIFFKKESTIFGFVIDSDHATFILKYPDRVYFYIYASICFFNFFEIQFLVMIFFTFYLNSLQTFFFLPYHVCKQFILSFQTLQTIFFSIFLMHTPSRKIMVRPWKILNVMIACYFWCRCIAFSDKGISPTFEYAKYSHSWPRYIELDV